MTLEQGLMKTWHLPLFSAVLMLLRASARTFMHAMVAAWEDGRKNSFHFFVVIFSKMRDLEDVMLSKVSQAPKGKYCMVSLIWNPTKLISQKQWLWAVGRESSCYYLRVRSPPKCRHGRLGPHCWKRTCPPLPHECWVKDVHHLPMLGHYF